MTSMRLDGQILRLQKNLVIFLKKAFVFATNLHIVKKHYTLCSFSDVL